MLSNIISHKSGRLRKYLQVNFSSVRIIRKCNNKDFSTYPVSIYMFKVNNRKTRTRYEICSKLTIKTPEQCQWHCSGVSIVNFEQVNARWIGSKKVQKKFSSELWIVKLNQLRTDFCAILS